MLPDESEFGPRRKVRSRASRIARPKDAMPFARHRAARAVARFRGGSRRAGFGRTGGGNGGGGKAGGTVTAVPVLDRAALAPTFGLGASRDMAADDAGVLEDDGAGGLSATVKIPLCLRHAEPCVLLACRRGRNAGRHFFKCSRTRMQQCDFFKWADEVAKASPSPDEVDDGNSDGDGDYNNQEVPSRTALFPFWVEAPAIYAVPGGDGDDATAEADDNDDDCDGRAASIEDALVDVFGFESWRPGQQATVQRLLDGRSALAVLPTAAGKSLIYQMVAAVRPGLVIVITPLVALMRSQRASAPDALPTAFLSAGQSLDEVTKVEHDVRTGAVKVLFVAPERLFSPSFRALMATSDGFHPPVSLVVVDEAHCVSQWGHNFRTAYLRLPSLLFPAHACNSRRVLFAPGTPVLALTATATVDTQRDICRSFGIDFESGVVRCEVKRSNLSLTLSTVGRGVDTKAFELVHRLNSKPFSSILGIAPIEKAHTDGKGNNTSGNDCDDDASNTRPRSSRKRRRVTSVNDGEDDDDETIGWGSNRNVTKRIQAKRRRSSKTNGCVIVYVSKQRDCESVRNYLTSSSLRIAGSIAAYHGGMSAQERTRVQASFEKGNIGILIATVAFGLGIHCDGVSGVIHFDLPSSIETYAQEIGRAGRDGRGAHCHVFFSEFDGMRLLSRSHMDGIDLNAVRQVVRGLVDGKFPFRRIIDRCSDSTGKLNKSSTRPSVGENNTANEDDSDCHGESSAPGRSNQGSEPMYVLSLTEDELCKELDVKFETGETIAAILESHIDGLELTRTSNAKLAVRFFSESPEALLQQSTSKALTSLDKAVLQFILKHSKHSNGRYVLQLSRVGVTEVQITRVLRRLQAGGLLSFDASERALQLQCSSGAFQTLAEDMRDWSMCVHEELARMECAQERKARALVSILREADGLPSDGEQSAFLHAALDKYFAKGCADCSLEDNIGRHTTESPGQGRTKCSEKRWKQVREATMYVLDERTCGSAEPRTGRQIARVLHGLDAGRLTAKNWWQCKMWGRFIDVDFETVRQIACQVVRDRHHRSRIQNV